MKVNELFPKSKRIVLQTCLIILISFFMGEITLRIYHYINPIFIFYSDSYNRYRGKPYADDYHFKLNSLGFKDKEFTEKIDNVYRIIGIGDSFTFGIVPYNYNYLTLLESQLLQEGPNIEILNMGIPGAGPKDYLSLFVREGLNLKPDMLLLSFFIGNDFTDSLKRERGWYNYSYVTSLFYYLITIKSKYEGIIVHGKGDYYDDRPTFNEEAYLKIEGDRSFIYLEGNDYFVKLLNLTLYYLSLINDICKKHNIEFVVVLIPDELQINNALQKEVIDIYYPKLNKMKWNIILPNQMLGAGLDKLGIKYIDLYASFSGRSGERLYRLRDTHWNIAGNQLAANILKERLVTYLRENPNYRSRHGAR
jgi:hypothetical protein